MATTTRTTRTRLSATERREALLDAGWQLVREHGARTLTIDAVVQRLGISRPIFYRHFRDRADLLVALYERYAHDLLAVEDAAFAHSEGPFENLVARVTGAYFDKVERDAALIRAVIHEAQDDPRMINARARLRDNTAARWRNALLATAPDHLARALRADGRVTAVYTTLLEMLQEAAVQGATMLLEGRAARRDVDDAVAIINDGIVARLASFARATETETGQ
jgi:AcrR family transcriptional regulator